MDWFDTEFINKETEEIESELIKCADCGKVINKKDADYSLGKDRPLCQNCFEAREHNNAWY